MEHTNFQNHMITFANEKDFVWNSQSDEWKKAEEKFNQYSEDYKEVMPYQFFKENIMGEKSPVISNSHLNPLFASILKSFAA